MGDWILEAVMAFLRSPEYTTPVMNFIDEKCVVFDTDEESKLEFTNVHTEFVSLVFGLLEGFLAEIGVSQEEFSAECEKALSSGGETAFVYHQIMAVEDFPSFKGMMAKRNRELELELLRELQAQQQQAGMIEPMLSDAIPDGEAQGEAAAADGVDLEAQERAELEAALRLSRMTFEHGEQHVSADEAAQLEEAIRQSKLLQQPQHQFGEDVPHNEESEQEMLARALKESMQNTPKDPAAADAPPPAAAVLPPRKVPPPAPPASEKVIEEVKKLSLVTDEQIRSLEAKHELAVVEHALAVSEALNKTEDESEDEDFTLEKGPGPARTPPATSPGTKAPEATVEAAPAAAPPVAKPSNPSSSLPPFAPPAQAPPAQATPPPEDPASGETSPLGSAKVSPELAPAASADPSLPGIKPTPGSSFPSLARPPVNRDASLAGMSVEDMERIERKNQKKRDKERREKEQAMLAKKAKELQEKGNTGGENEDPEEVERRKKHLQEQRQRLLEAKKKEREEALEKERSSKQEGALHPMIPKAKRTSIGGEVIAAAREADRKPAGAGEAVHTLSEQDRKRAELRRALSQRIKDDLSSFGGSS